MSNLIDTNICIAYLNGKSADVKDNFLKHNPEDIFLCSVVKAELIYGAIKSYRTEKNIEKLDLFFEQFTSLPFDDRSSNVYGKIRADLEQSGNIIGPNDLLIASITLANDMTLVTNNTNEFNRVQNLKLIDWK